MRRTADPPARARRLGPPDLPAVAELQAVVGAGLPPGFLWPRGRDELGAYLDGTLGAAYGIGGDAGAPLATAALLRVPGADRPLAGPRLPRVPEEDWPLRACFLEGTMVAPAARGRGHQRALVRARSAHAAAVGMRWLCAGIRLDNVASWRNLLAEGMAITGIRLDPGYPIIGLLCPVGGGPALASDPADRALVGTFDAAEHEAALGRGYAGVRLAPDGAAMVYERLLP